MPSPAELVAALSRAYALTEVFPGGDPVSLDALGHLRSLLSGGAEVEVAVAGLRVDGIEVPDFHGRSGRFARDLRLLGVDVVRFRAGVSTQELERFVRVLREDSAAGVVAGLRELARDLAFPVGLVFEGEAQEAEPPGVPGPEAVEVEAPEAVPASDEGVGEDAAPVAPEPPQTAVLRTPEREREEDPERMRGAVEEPDAGALSEPETVAVVEAHLPAPVEPAALRSAEPALDPPPSEVDRRASKEPPVGPLLLDLIAGLFSDAPAAGPMEAPRPPEPETAAERRPPVQEGGGATPPPPPPSPPPTEQWSELDAVFASGVPDALNWRPPERPEGDDYLPGTDVDLPDRGGLQHPLSFLDEVGVEDTLEGEVDLVFEPTALPTGPLAGDSAAGDGLGHLPPSRWERPEGEEVEEAASGAGRPAERGTDSTPTLQAAPPEPVGTGPWEASAGRTDILAEDGAPGEEAGPAGSPVSPPMAEASLVELAGQFLTAFDPEVERLLRERAAGVSGLRPGALDDLVDAVLLLLDSGDGTARALALELAGPGVTTRLAARLAREPDPEARAELARRIMPLGEPIAGALVEALAEETDRGARRAFVDTLVALGPAGRAAVDRMLGDGRWYVVRNGVAIVGEVGGEDALSRLIPAAAHPEARVRREALAALARLGGEDAGQVAEAMLEDRDPEVRGAAARAVGALRRERALTRLQEMLASEEEPRVLEAVIGALGALGDPSAVPALEKRAVGSFFSRPPTLVRVAAYRALWAIGTPHATQLVESARSDRDPGVRAAVTALVRRGREMGGDGDR